MANEIFDLDKLSKDDDFAAQLQNVAEDMLADGKAKGWKLDSISYPEPESDNKKTYVSVTSTGLYNSRLARFSAVCDNGVCHVSYINFFDPDQGKLGIAY